VLLPRADIADKILAEGITRLGAEVEEVAAYITKPAAGVKHKAVKALADGEIDIITFTSSSTVTGLLSILDSKLQLINNTVVACIGPKTAATAEQAGIRVDVLAQEHTIAGLLDAMEQYFAQKGEG
jgi:uroporphyrinogen III methyltransferase/synthase